MILESDLDRAHAILQTIAIDRKVSELFLKELGYDDRRTPFVATVIELVAGSPLKWPGLWIFEGEERLHERFILRQIHPDILEVEGYKAGALQVFREKIDGLSSERRLHAFIILNPDQAKLSQLERSLVGGSKDWKGIDVDCEALILARRPDYLQLQAIRVPNGKINEPSSGRSNLQIPWVRQARTISWNRSPYDRLRPR